MVSATRAFLVGVVVAFGFLIGAHVSVADVIQVDAVDDVIDASEGALIELTPGHTYTVTLEGTAYLGPDIEATGIICLTWEDNGMSYRQYRRIHHLAYPGDAFTFTQLADPARTWFFAFVPDYMVLNDNSGGYTLRFTSPDEPQQTFWVDAQYHAVDVDAGASYTTTPGRDYTLTLGGMAYIGNDGIQDLEASGVVCLTWDALGNEDRQKRILRVMEWPGASFTYTTFDDPYYGTLFFVFIVDVYNMADNWGAYALQIDPGTAAEENPTGGVRTPRRLCLGAISPNPVRSELAMTFGLPGTGVVDLDIFDARGRQVGRLVSGRRQAGYHRVSYRVEGLPVGSYIARLRSDGRNAASRFVIAR